MIELFHSLHSCASEKEVIICVQNKAMRTLCLDRSILIRVTFMLFNHMGIFPY